MKTKKIFTNITAGLCFAVLVLSMGYMSFNARKSSVLCSQVLRFHILASSNSYEDIALKHKVREALEPVARQLFSSCKSFDEAKRVAKSNEKLLQSKAAEALSKQGCTYEVSVHTDETEYDKRILSGILYPKGKYCSVTVTLGKGEGTNVWCVLFSPFSDTGIEWQEGDGKTRLRLKFLDWLKEKQGK